MIERIDHVIAASAHFRNLEAAFSHIGFHLSGGGTHPHLGTRNRIIVLEDSYIELLGVENSQIASSTLRKRLRATASGWVGFALQSSDIRASLFHLRAAGAQTDGPTPGTLVADNGAERSWNTVQIIQGVSGDLWSNAEPLPFVIQHDSSGEEHRKALAGTATLAHHANGATRIAEIVVAARDPVSMARRYQDYFDLTSGDDRGDKSSADRHSLRFQSGNQILTIAASGYSGVVSERLARAGEGLALVRVHTDNLDAARSFFVSRGVRYTDVDSDVVIDPDHSAGVAVQLTEE